MFLLPPPKLLRSVAALFAAALTACAGPSPTRSTDFVPLFDGTSLAGWSVQGGSATYRVEAGEIVGRTSNDSKNTFLCTVREYGDFEFACDVRCDPALNSGIQIRSHTYERDTPQASDPKRMREKGVVYGYQCDIARSEQAVAGNFWDEARRTKWLDDLAKKPGAGTAFKNREWNHYRIVAQGDRIRSWVNGIPCADFRDPQDTSGFFGLQVHAIPAGAGPFEVRWKNLVVRELSPTEIVNE